MTLATYARELAANFRGAQFSSVAEQNHNESRAVGLDILAIRLEHQEKTDAPLQDG